MGGRYVVGHHRPLHTFDWICVCDHCPHRVPHFRTRGSGRVLPGLTSLRHQPLRLDGGVSLVCSQPKLEYCSRPYRLWGKRCLGLSNGNVAQKAMIVHEL